MSDPILLLQHELQREFDHDARGSRVARMLSTYAAEHEDWRRFALFDPDVYTRNLIGRTEHYEMLLLCWNVGQKSPIHNHAGQNCWMAVMEGQVQETLKSASILDPTSELNRFEERIRRQEAQVRGMEEVSASSLDQQFADLESNEDEHEVDARLAALKTGS